MVQNYRSSFVWLHLHRSPPRKERRKEGKKKKERKRRTERKTNHPLQQHEARPKRFTCLPETELLLQHKTVAEADSTLANLANLWLRSVVGRASCGCAYTDLPQRRKEGKKRRKEGEGRIRKRDKTAEAPAANAPAHSLVGSSPS